MTPRDLRAARKAMGLTQSELAAILRLSAKNGDRSIRVWETEGNTIPGPVQVAVECLLNHGKVRDASYADGYAKAIDDAAGVALDPCFIQARDDEWDTGFNDAKRIIAHSIRAIAQTANGKTAKAKGKPDAQSTEKA